jgi:hypothetical protein
MLALAQTRLQKVHLLLQALLFDVALLAQLLFQLCWE